MPRDRQPNVYLYTTLYSILSYFSIDAIVVYTVYLREPIIFCSNIRGYSIFGQAVFMAIESYLPVCMLCYYPLKYGSFSPYRQRDSNMLETTPETHTKQIRHGSSIFYDV